jgi:glycosyltransferase involved in cell wall biosynthesis
MPPHRIKIAHVTTVDLSLRLLLLNQLRKLQRSGYDVTGISASGPHVAVLEEQGIRHLPVPTTRALTPLTDLIALCRLYWVMRRERFTIVHCHTPKAELLGQLAARLAGVPVVVNTFRGIYAKGDAALLRRWFFMALARIAASCTDLVLCQSREAMEAAVRTGVCPANRIAHLGNGIDLRRFDRLRLDPQELEAARAALGLKPGAPVVGFVGRLVREKGVLDLLHAMREVRERVPGAQLLVVGPIDHDKRDAVTPEMAKRHGLDDATVFTGMRTDVPAMYALMDLCVLPSYRESFPRAPMEAAAMGVPCIVTDISGCREVVDNNRTGLLVPVGDRPALADAIVSLLTRPDTAREMAGRARQRAVESFDEDRVFDMLRGAYAHLLFTKGIPLPRVAPSPVAAPATGPFAGTIPRLTQS